MLMIAEWRFKFIEKERELNQIPSDVALYAVTLFGV